MNQFEIGDRVSVYLDDGDFIVGEVSAINQKYLPDGRWQHKYFILEDYSHNNLGPYREEQLELIVPKEWSYGHKCDMGCAAVGASRHVPLCSAWRNI